MAEPTGTNNKGTENKAVKVSAVEKAQNVRAICVEWAKVFDPDRPAPKKDLSFGELSQILLDKSIDIGSLITSKKLNPVRSLSKQPSEFFVAIKGKFAIDDSDKNIEDARLEIAEGVNAYMQQNYPHIKKRFTPATITGLELYEVTDGKVALRSLGFNPRRMKLKHADEPVVKELKNAMANLGKEAA